MRSTPYFFGYGSLVNSATHGYPDAQRAQLRGWRRLWCHTDLRPVAFLSVVRDPATTLDGMIAHVPGSDWAALDEREWAYDRVEATDQVVHGLERSAQIAVYSVPGSSHTSKGKHPILLSYLDVVVQGYLHAFGPAGAMRFFETTDGWDAPILNDRADPRYPRHQALSSEERGFVDASLARLSAVIKHLD